MMVRGRLQTWIETNIWAVLAAGVTAWSGFLTGLMAMKTQIADLERRVAVTEGELRGRRPLMVCVVRSLDQINNSLHTAPPCTTDVPE